MKNKKPTNDYSRFQKKIFRGIIQILAVSLVAVFFVREAVRGKLGNIIVSVLMKFFYLGDDEAHSIYWNWLRSNIGIIIGVIIILICLFLLRVGILRITKYFDEISHGMDILIHHPEIEISLSPELGFMESKLKECRSILEKRERDAKWAEQRKNDLVVYLAHDIRTPLTSVIGYLDLMDEVPDMPLEQRKKYLHITLDKANRLESLINEFFEITRFNLQAMTLEKESVHLTFMLQQMTDEFYPMLQEKGQTIVFNSKEYILVEADANKLARVFHNILKNAVAYGDYGTPIVIFLQKTQDEISIIFQNQGKHIAKEKLDSLFEKFYRLDQSRSSNTGNAGLGLAIAKEIVLLHGGEIYAESEENTIRFIVKLKN